MKIIQKYLCELCSHAIARQQGQDQYEFVVCAMNADGFPIEKQCSQFAIEDGIME
jgi:hypothetical protein